MSSATRTSLPMIIPAAPFNLTDVVTCANLVEVAYNQYCQWEEQGKPSESDFTWTPKGVPTELGSVWTGAPLWADSRAIVFMKPEPFGFLLQDSNGRAFLVLRGTESDADKYKDLEVGQVPYTLVSNPSFGNVHKGFFGIYSSMSSAIHASVAALPAPATAFFFTGHSLGSSLITLAVPDVIYNAALPSGITVMHYNFASPRTGDETFANALNAIPGLPTYRIVNTEDLVPDVPFAVTRDLRHSYLYKHVGTTADFTAQYDSVGNNHSMMNSYLYAVNNPQQPEGPIVQSSGCQPSLPLALLATPA
ncbi:MAG TPA: lipase family protein [Candidatus Kapabacteria bacterium]|nr:lipase family protein [Candidatus Kapabacteria bacterium]